jgi:hypothetical protein
MERRYNCEQTDEKMVANKQDHKMVGYFVVFVVFAAIVYSMTSDATITKVFAFLKKYKTFVWIYAAIMIFGLIIFSIISVTELKTEKTTATSNSKKKKSKKSKTKKSKKPKKAKKAKKKK